MLQSSDAIPSMRQRHPSSKTGAAQLFPLLQSAEQSLSGFNLMGEVRNLPNQLCKHGIPPTRSQRQFNRGPRQQLAELLPWRCRHTHTLTYIGTEKMAKGNIRK